MENYLDEFYLIENGKIKNVYMTYGKFRKLKTKFPNLYSSYRDARASLRRSV